MFVYLYGDKSTSLSTESFMAAFRRFISRRGMCTDLYSDCGTNFIGTSKELQILFNRNKSSLPEELIEMLAIEGTKCHFIPPASPNFGGLWEAGVKSTKYHLKRLLDSKIVTYEELSTLLAQIESCLNSRPLCPLNNDPTDVVAITPSHFLIGEASNCLPEEDLMDINIDRLTRWKAIEQMKQHFWQRWRNEWLCRLQSRPKWLKPTKNTKVGDLVLIFDERCPPGKWPLARVKELHPGRDGIERVVTLQCNDKIFKRPVSKIAYLPSDEDFEKLQKQHE